MVDAAFARETQRARSSMVSLLDLVLECWRTLPLQIQSQFHSQPQISARWNLSLRPLRFHDLQAAGVGVEAQEQTK